MIATPSTDVPGLDGTASDVVRLAADLVACRTANPPGREAPACRVVADYLGRHGVVAEVRALDGDARANLVARLPGGDGPGLMLSGHLDVVPANADGWRTDPFVPTVIDGRMHGRGTVDMKGAVAAMAVAVARLAERGTVPPGDVVLALTAGEEVDFAGARALAAEGALDGIGTIVIGEPTGLDVGIGHKGALWVDVATAGVAAHASQPQAGDSALLRLLDWLEPVETLQALLGSDAHALLGAPTASVTMLSAGSAPNILPDRAHAVLDLRTLPQHDHRALLEALRRRGADATVTVLRDAPAVMCDADAPILRIAAAAVTELTGRRPRTRGLPYFTDGSVFAPCSDAAIVLLGPGDERLAHQADESVELAALDAAARIYERIARSFR
ncbi:MAG: M20 family metallopeptidase [Actinobacteria bacterium]|nr:M20 family metallopeptidase [Actinomycetota bacterium]